MHPIIIFQNKNLTRTLLLFFFHPKAIKFKHNQNSTMPPPHPSHCKKRGKKEVHASGMSSTLHHCSTPPTPPRGRERDSMNPLQIQQIQCDREAKNNPPPHTQQLVQVGQESSSSSPFFGFPPSSLPKAHKNHPPSSSFPLLHHLLHLP